LEKEEIARGRRRTEKEKERNPDVQDGHSEGRDREKQMTVLL